VVAAAPGALGLRSMHTRLTLMRLFAPLDQAGASLGIHRHTIYRIKAAVLRAMWIQGSVWSNWDRSTWLAVARTEGTSCHAAARFGKSSRLPFAERTSSFRFRPSTQPYSARDEPPGLGRSQRDSRRARCAHRGASWGTPESRQQNGSPTRPPTNARRISPVTKPTPSPAPQLKAGS